MDDVSGVTQKFAHMISFHCCDRYFIVLIFKNSDECWDRTEDLLNTRIVR